MTGLATSLRRTLSVYGAFALNMPKLFLAYRAWVFAEVFVQLLGMVIFAYFWRAVYAGQSDIRGLSLQQTLNYVLISQVFLQLAVSRMILYLGDFLREGKIVLEMARPVDFQGRFYAETLAELAMDLTLKAPLLLVAVFAFGLTLPADPLVWGAFFVSLFIGQTALFCFDWLFCSLAFYTTEVWGLSVFREGVGTFFSGALVPLALMPGWLEAVAQALSFAQAFYIPVSLLSGITPLEDIPQLWLVQLAWLAGLFALSRIVFRVAARKVTVQGG